MELAEYKALVQQTIAGLLERWCETSARFTSDEVQRLQSAVSSCTFLSSVSSVAVQTLPSSSVVTPSSAAAAAATCLENLQFVGTKLLKLAASSFAYQSFPSADTEKLTALVANCVSNEHLTTLLTNSRLERDTQLHLLLGFASRVLGPQAATRGLLAHFQSVVDLAKEALDIPQIICSLRPGTQLQGKTRDERIALVAEELKLRGIDVREPREVESEEDFLPPVFVVDIFVVRGTTSSSASLPTGVRASLNSDGNELESSLTFGTFQEAREAVLVRARKFIRDAKAFQKSSHTAGSAAEGGESSASKRRYLTIDEVDPSQAASFGNFVMHTVKRILRFDSPFDLMLQKLGRYSHCIDSGGWVPLADIVDVLQDHHKSTCSIIEPPTADFVTRLLEDHDGMQRFEVGICDVAGSILNGLSCARALYAHQGHCEGGLPLYKSILDSWSRPDSCPSSGWILVDKKFAKTMKQKGFKLYDNNVIVTVVQSAHLTMFERYLKRAALPHETTPYSQRVMLDEKIRSPMLFMEVFLGAAFEDSHMTVKQHPPRGDMPGHHVLVPAGHRYLKKVKGLEHRYFPMAFLSGRTAELRCYGDGDITATSFASGHSSVIFHGRIEIPDDPFVSFGPGELESLLQRGKAQLVDPEEEALQTLGEIATSKLPDGAETEPPAAPPSMSVERLDDKSIRDTVQAFHSDPQRVMLELEIPRSNGQVTYFERTKTVGELKKWMLSLGLRYQEIASTRATIEIFLIRKPQAFPEHVIDDLVKEAGLKPFGDRSLLRRAITRECVDREDNYERLEFIGDAILDFIMVQDAFVVFGLNGRHSILQVAADVCRNEVLCELLPRVIEEHLTMQFGEGNVHRKTKADMIEAMVGAVFEDRQGLVEVRRFVSNLYQVLPRRHYGTTDNPELKFKLQNAIRLCPYLFGDRVSIMKLLEGDDPFAKGVLDCYDITTVSSQELQRSSNRGTGPAFKTWQSHKASTGFPRVQDKDFATHFTTGNVYSYRRLTSCDHLPQLMNRVLWLHHNGEIGFVNETLRSRTKLTFDIDGVNVHSFGILSVIAVWFAKVMIRDNRRLNLCSSPPRTTSNPKFPMGIVLDCSGMSVVSKKIKRSCHVHFPQVTCTLEALKDYTTNLRSFLVQHFSVNVRRGCVGTGRIVVATCSVRTPTAAPQLEGHATVSNNNHSAVVVGRVILDMNLVRKRFDEIVLRAYELKYKCNSPYVTKPAEGPWNTHRFFSGPSLSRHFVHRVATKGDDDPNRNRNHIAVAGGDFDAIYLSILSFLPLPDLLVRFQLLSRAHHEAVTMFLALMAERNPKQFTQCVYATVSPEISLSPISRNATNPVISTPQEGQLPPSLVKFHAAWCTAINAGMAEWFSVDGRLPECSPLCRCLVLRTMRPPFTSFAEGQPMIVVRDISVPPSLRSGLVEVFPPASSTKIEEIVNDASLDGFLEHNAHLMKKKNTKSKEYLESVIRSLQEKSIFDRAFWEKTIDHGLVDSKKLRWYLNDKWDTVYHQEYRPLIADTLIIPDVEHPQLIPARHGVPGNVQLSHASILELTSLHCPQYFTCYGEAVDLLDDSIFYSEDDDACPIRTRVTQSTFQECAERPPVTVNDWQLWTSGVFSTSEVRLDNNGSQKAQRHSALRPSWWRFLPGSQGSDGVAEFVVSNHVYMRVRGPDLRTCLSSGGGMLQLNRVMTPHILVQADWKQPLAALPNELPLFCEWRSGSRVASPIGTVVSSRTADGVSHNNICQPSLSVGSGGAVVGAATAAAGVSSTPSLPFDHLLRPDPSHGGSPATETATVFGALEQQRGAADQQLHIPAQRYRHVQIVCMKSFLSHEKQWLDLESPALLESADLKAQLKALGETLLHWLFPYLQGHLGAPPILVVVPSENLVRPLESQLSPDGYMFAWADVGTPSSMLSYLNDVRRYQTIVYLGRRVEANFCRVLDAADNPSVLYCLYEEASTALNHAVSTAWRK